MAIHQPGPPPQNDSVGFVLSGSEQEGWLLIQSPLGQALAELRWSGADLSFREGASIRSMQDAQPWIQRWLGASLKPSDLFRVLQDPSVEIPNWDIDRRSAQHLRLTRKEPPQIQIRLVVDERPNSD